MLGSTNIRTTNTQDSSKGASFDLFERASTVLDLLVRCLEEVKRILSPNGGLMVMNPMGSQSVKKRHLQQMGVSKNRDTPKWMVYNGKPYQNGSFGGYHYFRKHPNPSFCCNPFFWCLRLQVFREHIIHFCGPGTSFQPRKNGPGIEVRGEDSGWKGRLGMPKMINDG